MRRHGRTAPIAIGILAGYFVAQLIPFWLFALVLAFLAFLILK